jgi:hypothetical protein
MGSGGHETRKGEKVQAYNLSLEILKYGYYMEGLGQYGRIMY